MPIKEGMGGHGKEAYDPETGKYVSEGFSESEEKVLGSMGLSKYDVGPKFSNIDNIKKEWDSDGLDDSDSPKKFNDIYNDYFEKYGKEPEHVSNLIDFVKDEINNHYKDHEYSKEEFRKEVPYRLKRKRA